MHPSYNSNCVPFVALLIAAFSIQPAIAGEREIAKIAQSSCDSILMGYDPQVPDYLIAGIRTVQYNIGIPNSEFGTAEAAATLGKLRDCFKRAKGGERNILSGLIAKLDIILNMQAGYDELALKPVDLSRNARVAADSAAARAAAQKDADNLTVEKILAEINAIDVGGSMAGAYNTIFNIRREIAPLPADMRADLLDNLTIKQAPLDKRKGAAIADIHVQFALIQTNNDNGEKLRLLADLAKRARILPDSDYETVRSTIDASRSALRSAMEAEATKTASAQENSLREIGEKEAAAETERKAAADASKAQATMYAAQMFIAKHCANLFEPDLDAIHSLAPIPGKPVVADPNNMTAEQLAQGQPRLDDIEINPIGTVYKAGSPKDIEAKCAIFGLGLTNTTPATYKLVGASDDPKMECRVGQHMMVTSGGVFCVNNRYD